MNSEKKLKRYQFRKYGVCFNCKTKVEVLNCHMQCSNCGYAENWHEISTYLDDRSENESKGNKKEDRGKN